ncbi:hypothetical protein BZB76_1115 [Actinomadura pelletieri DSM 43383]|uniref:Uncharacterized protein n=1 Tax=Actinomadura pelletieri DSM 43383 TaxID=1120940 RepID=A0A495QZN9_9ACTN|nr:ATP-binding protein [Actinomadura pelletieri]RKS79640.1 hypothetical protein BZB76_1115 [Actinomadura pelletieri DSM 43383]
MSVPPQHQHYPDDDADDDEPVQTPGSRYAPPPGAPAPGPGAPGPGAPGTGAPGTGAPRPGPPRPGAPGPGRPDAGGAHPGGANGAGEPGAEEADADDTVTGRIGIIGPTGSGKTTFLGAIRVALEEREAGLIWGTDAESRKFLTEASDRLHRQRVFPNATRSLPPNLSFKLRIQRRNVRVTTKWKRRRRVTRTAMVSLDVLDAPGGMYGGQTPDAVPQPGEPATQSAMLYSDADLKRLAEHVAASSGLILLLDPVRETNMNDSYDYLQYIIVEIAARARFRRNDPHLPHHLAVCITKFDHPHVYNAVNRQGLYLEPRGEYEFPYAPSETAREYFDLLCEEQRSDTGMGDTNSTRQLRNVIRQYFSPRRTRFFLTSAVGFRVDPRTRRFLPTAPENVSYQEFDGKVGQWILGTAHPVNVLEPLMWLVQQQFKDDGR